MTHPLHPDEAEQAPIFLDYSQQELDKAYDQRAWAANWRELNQRYALDSEWARSRHRPSTEPYGSSEDEVLDIFSPKGAQQAPVLVFIHGGAWRALSKDEAAAPAEQCVREGYVYVALNFSLIPQVRLPEMAEQCRRALLWLAANIARFGGDPERIYVAGHSSGGHLCGVMLTTDWSAYGAAADLIKGGMALSGMFELHPVMLSARREYVSLSAAEIEALSPMRQLGRINCPVIVGWGDGESPEFARQSQVFAAALAGMGRLHGRYVLAETNHFELMERFYQPDNPIWCALKALIAAAPLPKPGALTSEPAS